MEVIKRDCSKAPFNPNKIEKAILKAMKYGSGRVQEDVAEDIANEIEIDIHKQGLDEVSIYEIERLVFEKLCNYDCSDEARAYEGYRKIREYQRDITNTTDCSIHELLNGDSEYWKTENSNKNATLVTTQRDYLAGITSKDITKRYLLTPEIVQGNDEGIIHFHDEDYFAQKALFNCDLINLEDMLQNGTMINGVMIEKPHRFLTAMTIATQIITAVTSSQYGGASITLAHLAPFVKASENEIRKAVEEEVDIMLESISDSWGFRYKATVDEIVRKRLLKEVKDGVQTFNYQINSMSTTNGQSPFLSVFMYLGETNDYKEELAMIIEEFLHQRIQGMKNEKGVYVAPAFPKLLYVTEEDNINEDSKYYYLTKLAAKCTAKRLVPDYISEKEMKRLKEGNCFPVMGCRSALSPWYDNDGKVKFYGRFNQGVVTISLPDVALSSRGDIIKFWDILEERSELCHKALVIRHERLEGTLSDVAPILWQHGAIARLKKGETIDKLLHGGYSSISLGYAGLYECVKYMTGSSHTDNGEGKKLGLKVLEFLNDKCEQWKKEDDIGYGIYGSPIESTTYKFAKCLKKRFGAIEGITDRDYITNSYHVPVFENIDAFTKLKLESEFQALSLGGSISYVEVPNMQNNIDAVLDIIKFMYNNIMYAEINTKSDYCHICGFDGEILINENMQWYCPNCGNMDKDKMNVIRRTCGYCGTNFWNFGRSSEIHDRVLHL
ncbi:MAG: anaerobic ribonucleoside-triphosphate reductase [Cellulosilyticaceae bacterium]